jgi:hypothetical protein
MKKKKYEENSNFGLGMSLGLVFGMTVLGKLFDNSGTGIALGLSLGVMWDVIMSGKGKKS